jgi:hypothetical protein
MIYPTNNTPVNYAQFYQYPLSKPINTGPAGGQTIRVIAIVIASGILIGMALGLGLGIGAAGIVSNGMLVNVTNTTANSTVTSTTTFSTTTTFNTTTVNG